MNILLINTSPVVSRMISLCMREEDMQYEEVENISNAKEKNYDIVFVDDLSCDEKTGQMLSVLHVGKKILLSAGKAGKEMKIYFDEVIHKPFLPSQIDTLLKNTKREKREKEILMPSIFPLSAEEEEEYPLENFESLSGKEKSVTKSEDIQRKETQILDQGEIEKIKDLRASYSSSLSIPSASSGILSSIASKSLIFSISP